MNYTRYKANKVIYTFSSCTHWHQAIPIGSKIIFASAKWSIPDKGSLWEAGQKPHLFVGLSSSWLGEFSSIVVAGVNKTMPQCQLPHIIVDWDDQKPCPYDAVYWLIHTIRNYLHAGKRVDIGCLGGHGRTGALLALLIGKEENLSPKKAIEETRRRYCDKAVESMSQIHQIYTLLGSTVERAEEEWKVKPIAYTFNRGQKFNWKEWWAKESKNREKQILNADEQDISTYCDC